VTTTQHDQYDDENELTPAWAEDFWEGQAREFLLFSCDRRADEILRLADMKDDENPYLQLQIEGQKRTNLGNFARKVLAFLHTK